VKSTVAIVDYGSGNLNSARKAFERVIAERGLHQRVIVTAEPEAVAAADRLLLPGVGAFADCRRGIEAIPGMAEAIREHAMVRARPFLGICVGMQLMAERGLEHGVTEGFGWIAGDIAPIEPADSTLKIPHMGWNNLEVTAIGRAHPVMRNLDRGVGGVGGVGPHAYFVHSYALSGGSADQVLATVDHGGAVVAVVGRDNLVGTQFHPEKSQSTGLALIENFLTWKP